MVSAQDGDTKPVKGAANSWADSMKFQLVNANTTIGWTFGTSTSVYKDITGTSEGRAMDLAALGALLGQPQCGGKYPAVIPSSEMPPATVAESGVAGAAKGLSADISFPSINGAPRGPVMGTQIAKATDKPWSEASTALTNQDFALVRVEGSTTYASTEYDNGVRKATATSKAKRVIVLGGQIVFEEPVWTATAHSGSSQVKEAEFTYKGVRIFGNYVSSAQFETQFAFFKGLIESVLSPLGVKIEMPKVVPPTTIDEGVSISPIELRFENAPIGKYLLTPLFKTEVMKELRQRSVDEDCKNETVWTILDAVENALGGSGKVATLVGGATATTDDTDYSFTAPAPIPSETTPPSTNAPTTEQYTDDTLLDQTTYDDLPVDDTSYDDSSFDDTGLDDTTLDDSFDDSFDDTSFDEGALPFDESVDSSAGAADLDGGDGEEIAAAGKGGSDSTSNAAAIVVGALGLLGALALSLGDRVLGMKNSRRIA